jgi:nucleotide-binding universal stress UspA family protein
MFTKVLFCTDFSATADKAFKYAVRAAAHNGAKLHILHVMPEADAQFWKGYVYEEGQDLEDKALKALQEKVAATYLPHIPEAVEYETAYRVGAAAEQILDFAADKGIDLAVLGRQGAGGVRNLFCGNVAAEVAKAISCPILIVP